MATKEKFLAELRKAIEAKNYPWSKQPAPAAPGPTKLDYFMAQTEATLFGTQNLVNIDSESFVEAWRAIGKKGRPTYKALRALD